MSDVIAGDASIDILQRHNRNSLLPRGDTSRHRKDSIYHGIQLRNRSHGNTSRCMQYLPRMGRFLMVCLQKLSVSFNIRL